MIREPIVVFYVQSDCDPHRAHYFMYGMELRRVDRKSHHCRFRGKVFSLREPDYNYSNPVRRYDPTVNKRKIAKMAYYRLSDLEQSQSKGNVIVVDLGLYKYAYI